MYPVITINLFLGISTFTFFRFYLDAMEQSFVYVGELARFVYSRSGVINEYFITRPEGCQVDE